MSKKLTFDDVLLVPQYSQIDSRKDVDITVSIDTGEGPLKLEHPFIPANMDTVSGLDMVNAVVKSGGLGMLHRYLSLEETESCVESLVFGGKNYGDFNFAVSVGISSEEMYRALRSVELGCEIICVDVAHAHSKQVGEFVSKLRVKCPHIVIIAGNVVTVEAANFLGENGADLIKAGIGGGSVCLSRIVAGSGYPQFSAIQDCAKSAYPIIADGGIRSSGDACKALAAGASLVMLGSAFSGCDEAPGALVERSGGYYKAYRGMASREASEERFGPMPHWKTEEGVSTFVKSKGPFLDVLNHYTGGLRSGMSYSGARTLKEFWLKAKFVEVSSNTVVENSAHIKE